MYMFETFFVSFPQILNNFLKTNIELLKNVTGIFNFKFNPLWSPFKTGKY